jgi:hypothetical protein
MHRQQTARAPPSGLQLALAAPGRSRLVGAAAVHLHCWPAAAEAIHSTRGQTSMSVLLFGKQSTGGHATTVLLPGDRPW